MKSLVLLKSPTGNFPSEIWAIGYQAAPRGYAFKPLVGSFDVVKLGEFAAKHGLEAHIADAKHAREIHGVIVGRDGSAV